MPSSPNKLSQFWQELKRRNVTRVLAVYIASAFMILELVDMISEPFGLPEWSMKVAFFILIGGLIITVVISWIYDIRSEGGLVKTEPADKVQDEAIVKSTNGWQIASYISFVVIIGLILLNIIRGPDSREVLDKSIAVLPFDNDSPVAENEYYIKGYCTAVHSNLCKIEGLRVLNLLSTEQYRNKSKSIPEIAKEMDVGYVLSAKGQIINSRVRLTVYLTNASDEIIWSHPYDRQIEMVDDHISIQSEIAQLVAKELKVAITPEEKQIIEKVPTASLTALDFYQRGREEYESTPRNYTRAKDLFNKALQHDSTFSDAYIGLGYVYMNESGSSDIFRDDFLDSALILANKALAFDNQSSTAYTFRGIYFWVKGEEELALNDFSKAIELDPNNGEAYSFYGSLFINKDFVKHLDAMNKAASIDRGKVFIMRLKDLAWSYFMTGFTDKALHYYKEVLSLDGDSANYYERLGRMEYYMQNYDRSIEYFRKAGAEETSDIFLGRSLYLEGRQKESLEIFESSIQRMDESDNIPFLFAHRIAYSYWINGNKEKADNYFDLQIEYSQNLISTNNVLAQTGSPYYDLAGVYAFRGERNKAYENLTKFIQTKEFPAWVPSELEHDELFDPIRDEPEFQQIVRDVEAKYQASHEKVRKWLEENDML